MPDLMPDVTPDSSLHPMTPTSPVAAPQKPLTGCLHAGTLSATLSATLSTSLSTSLPATLNETQNRLLALAALFQAAQLTHLLATQGKAALTEATTPAYVVINQAALLIHPSCAPSRLTLDYYQPAEALQLGLHSVQGALMQPPSVSSGSRPRLPLPWHHSETLRYAMALLQLEKKLYKKPVFVQRIVHEQASIKQRLDFFDHNLLHPSLVASLATLYIDTAGQLTPRLSIRGKPDYLKQQPTIDTIRACLFAGIQAAHLWRQLGGTRWQLIFRRKNMLSELQQLSRLLAPYPPGQAYG